MERAAIACSNSRSVLHVTIALYFSHLVCLIWMSYTFYQTLYQEMMVITWDFLEVYGRETNDNHRPGAAPANAQSEVDRQNRELFKSQKVRDVVFCGECSKPRCVYSNKKMTTEQEELLRRIKEDRFYSCGGSLLPADSDNLGLVVKESVSCSSEVETNYFTTSLRHYLPPICIHCGSAENLLDDSDPYISSLYEEYSVVRPICFQCRNAGKDTKNLGGKVCF
ncbi:uncharacterized protein LOC130051279 [Ostrea edulis]|uniref:uncharacterized protein LOC130051279 n=1 Tax=Ostrea edulis TaxID=37623 RepID=UPI0024AECBCF|nr:uncharacterized protein LOC130051279 [Ostrea edulis]